MTENYKLFIDKDGNYNITSSTEEIIITFSNQKFLEVPQSVLANGVELIKQHGKKNVKFDVDNKQFYVK